MNTPLTGVRAKHQQLPDTVASFVREQIMSGHMKPGEFLRMEPIAEMVGVSITPVREGLLRLANEGFVTAVPRRGFVVAEFSRQDVRDLFWAQSSLSGELAARAAERISDEQLRQLETVMQQCDAAVQAHDTALTGALGHEFHRQINIAADSDRLARLLASIVKHLPNSFYASIESHVRTATPEHHELLAALKEHDADRARTITERHIINSADYVIDMLEKQNLWSDGD